MKTKFFVVMSMINIFFVTCEIDFKDQLYENVGFNRSINTITECSTKIAAKFFSSNREIRVISHEMDRKLSLLEAIFSKFTVTLTDNINDSKARENLILISNNISSLKSMFNTTSAHLYSHYLVFTQIPIEDLIEFAAYLTEGKYAYIAFSIIDSKQETVTVYQQKTSCWNCNNLDVSLRPTGFCYNHFSFNVEISGVIIPFKEILCPTPSCELRFIRVDYGATKEELYDISKNGTLMSADSYGACVLKDFARIHNIKISREEYVSNYNWYNTVKSLSNGEIDIAFGPTLPPYKLIVDLEKVVPYTFEEFIFIDAIPKLRPPIYVLITPLGIDVWICFGVVALMYLIYVVAIKKLNDNKLIYEKLNCLHLIAIFFNQVIRLPRKLGVRLAVSLWLIYAFFINTLYNCNFTSSMIKIKSPYMLQTFQELETSGRRFGGPDVAKEWLFNTEDPTMMSLYNRYEVIHPDNTSRALYELGMVVAQTDYVVSKTKMTNFYPLKEKIVSYPLLYYMPKGHPFTSHIAKFMEKIRELNVPLFQCLINAEKFVIEEFNAITMIHLQIIFKFLTLSHFISSLISFIEYFN